MEKVLPKDVLIAEILLIFHKQNTQNFLKFYYFLQNSADKRH